jgi:hypothetical protein
MCGRTPVRIYSGSALFRWLDKQFIARTTREPIQVGVGSIAAEIQGPQLGSLLCLHLRSSLRPSRGSLCSYQRTSSPWCGTSAKREFRTLATSDS